MEERNWAGLPADILVPITDRLSVPDKARSSSVCSSWRSAMKKFPSKSSPNNFPWLALIRVNLNRRSPLTFLNRTENRRRYHVPLTIPDLLSTPSLSYLGHKDGWLAVRFRKAPEPGLHSLLLFNPLTVAHSHLPSLNTLKKWDRDVITAYRIVLSASPSSTAGFVAVVAIGRSGHELAFARRGDLAWTPLHGPGTGVADIVYHDDGRFFALLSNDRLLSFDVSGRSPQVSVVDTGGRFDAWERVTNPSCRRILVSAPSGGLLQIRRVRYWNVLKLDGEADGWVETGEFVGNLSVFLDEKGAMVLSDVPGLEGNYIFFIDCEDSVSVNVRAFDMRRRTVEPCFGFGSVFKSKLASIWFRPSLS